MRDKSSQKEVCRWRSMRRTGTVTGPHVKKHQQQAVAPSRDVHETPLPFACSSLHALRLFLAESRNGLHDTCFERSPSRVRVATAMSQRGVLAP